MLIISIFLAACQQEETGSLEFDANAEDFIDENAEPILVGKVDFPVGHQFVL